MQSSHSQRSRMTAEDYPERPAVDSFALTRGRDLQMGVVFCFGGGTGHDGFACWASF